MAKLQKEFSDRKSRELALMLYDKWTRDRQRRGDIETSDDPKQLERIVKQNFESQYMKPRTQHFKDLKRAGDDITFADRVSLLATMELPQLEISTLLHRLAMQLADDPEARYFSPENLADNCGCGCGCCCAVLRALPTPEGISMHRSAKPFSIDPFNEMGTPQKVRDNLLASEFLSSYEGLSSGVGERVNARYFDMGHSFSG